MADLMEMTEFAEDNENCNYLLTVIDVSSKYAWAKPLKTKTGLETASAFNKIFDEGRIPDKIQSDDGMEFCNKNVKELYYWKKIMLNILAHFLIKKQQ